MVRKRYLVEKTREITAFESRVSPQMAAILPLEIAIGKVANALAAGANLIARPAMTFAVMANAIAKQASPTEQEAKLSAKQANLVAQLAKPIAEHASLHPAWYWAPVDNSIALPYISWHSTF